MKEIWKDVKDYEGLYQISNLGNVKSLERHTKTKNNITITIPNKDLKPLDNGCGYLTVHLRKDGKRKVHYIHRLVAESFIGEIKDKDINHKDFNTYNNNLSNLEICSRKENVQYSYKRDRYKGCFIQRSEIKEQHTKEKIMSFQNKIMEMYKEGIPKTIICKKLNLDNRTLTKYGINLPSRTTKGYEYKGTRIQCVETKEIFDSIASANKKYNVTTISDCISGRQKTSANLHWVKI